VVRIHQPGPWLTQIFNNSIPVNLAAQSTRSISVCTGHFTQCMNTLSKMSGHLSWCLDTPFILSRYTVPCVHKLLESFQTAWYTYALHISKMKLSLDVPWGNYFETEKTTKYIWSPWVWYTCLDGYWLHGFHHTACQWHTEWWCWPRYAISPLLGWFHI